MSKLSGSAIFKKLDDLEAPLMQVYSRGIKLSRITGKLQGSIDVTPLLGKFQQLGFVRIVFDPSVDEEPLVQVTEKGRQRALELLLSW